MNKSKGENLCCGRFDLFSTLQGRSTATTFRAVFQPTATRRPIAQ